jgi:hypothetical protein
MKWSILAAGFLIASAILFSNRFQVMTIPGAVYEVNRFSGNIYRLTPFNDGSIGWASVDVPTHPPDRKPIADYFR